MCYNFSIAIGEGGGGGREDNVRGKENFQDSIKSRWISQFLPQFLSSIVGSSLWGFTVLCVEYKQGVTSYGECWGSDTF